MENKTNKMEENKKKIGKGIRQSKNGNAKNLTQQK